MLSDKEKTIENSILEHHLISNFELWEYLFVIVFLSGKKIIPEITSIKEFEFELSYLYNNSKLAEYIFFTIPMSIKIVISENNNRIFFKK